MSDIVIRTPEQDLKFAQDIVRLTLQERKSSVKEPYYELKSETIYSTFEGLKYNTLRAWCMNGALGKKGADGKYYVTLSEIEKKLFSK